MGRKKKRTVPPQQAPAVSTSLGSLLGGLGFSASAPSEPEPASETTPSDDPLDLSANQNLKLHIERKGRRGKSVTLLEGLTESQSGPVAKALRKELGCGATGKGGVITIQGSQADRVRAWLISQGARRVKGV